MRVTSLAFTQPSGVTTHRFEKRSCGLSPVSERVADAFDCGRRLGRHP